MTRVLLDDELRRKLLDLTQPLELVDEAGQVVAMLMPTFDASEWDLTEPPISQEELDRRARSDEKRYTTAEVLEYLEKLQ